MCKKAMRINYIFNNMQTIFEFLPHGATRIGNTHKYFY